MPEAVNTAQGFKKIRVKIKSDLHSSVAATFDLDSL